jgi:hypothetical protein
MFGLIRCLMCHPCIASMVLFLSWRCIEGAEGVVRAPEQTHAGLKLVCRMFAGRPTAHLATAESVPRLQSLHPGKVKG